MIELRGKYGTAKVFTDNICEKSIGQIIELLNQEVFKDSQVRIMPDVHLGKGCVIGFTANLTGKVIPNLVGVDIGCGVYTMAVDKDYKWDFEKLDNVIRKYVPSGFNVHKKRDVLVSPMESDAYLELFKKVGISEDYALKSIGTLGGGNHFIEVNKDESSGAHFVNIHSGSRNLGHRVATYHQDKAVKYCRDNGIKVPEHLCYLEGADYEEYLRDMDMCQKYARYNRASMGSIIASYMDLPVPMAWHTVHNFIDKESGMIRKGAISAADGETITIPFNMRDGVIIATGKGNEDWNCSAPHGAGRIYSRSQAKKKLDLAEFQETMKDVYSTSVKKETLDESPMAYKPMDEVLKHVQDTIHENYILAKPVYNFKA